MTYVVSYFPLITVSAERKVGTAVTSIRSVLFFIPNLQGVGFADATGKSIKAPDPDQRPVDQTYFTFHSAVSTVTVVDRALDKLFSIGFSLRLPQTFDSLSHATGLSVPVTTDTPLIATPSRLVANLNLTLSNFTDEILAELGANKMRTLLADARNTPFPPVPTSFVPSSLFSTPAPVSETRPAPSSTPTMNRTRSTAPSSDITPFTGFLDFLDS